MTGRALRSLLAVLAMFGCGPADPPPSPRVPPPQTPAAATAPAVAPLDQGLLDAQRRIETEIEQYGSLDVDFEGEPVDLARPVTLDFGDGNGHGGNIAWVRVAIDGDTARCERVTWQAYRKDPTEVAGTSSRAEAPTATIRSLLDSVRALSRAKVTARKPGSSGSSSNDFFVLVRVCGAGSRKDRVWEFTGYEGRHDGAPYVVLVRVIEQAQEAFASMAWQPVAAEDLRRTHFTDAFARNRAFYGAEFPWWVLERSVEALGWFGDRTAVETLDWIRDNEIDSSSSGSARRNRKIAKVLDDPGRYLEGPPQEITEK